MAPFGWWVHFAMSFWYFRPYWLGVKVLCRSAWCHIFAGDTFFILTFVYFIVCYCLGTRWFSTLTRELLAPSWCYALFVFHTHVL